jgi:ATP-dependent Clp protease adaptor protein ClpS
MPPATLPTTGTTKHTRDQHAPLYNVVLLNDDDHTAEYVIEMLEKLFAIAAPEAWKHVVEVDSTGRTIVMTCDLQAAEFGRDQIHAFGADRRIAQCKGSMSAIVEPCPER